MMTCDAIELCLLAESRPNFYNSGTVFSNAQFHEEVSCSLLAELLAAANCCGRSTQERISSALNFQRGYDFVGARLDAKS